ncbi:MAG: nuclear transport factor 2 family protein [Candidatus Tumulicola sp.]
MTQTETENIALVKRGFEAFSAHDMTTLAELFDSTVRWLGPSTGILTGDYKGRDAVFASFAQLGQETDGTFRATPLSFAATGDDVFVNNSATGKRKGHDLEQEEVLIFTLKDGRVTKVRIFMRDQAAAELFWS